MEVKKREADLDTQTPRKRQRTHKGTGIEELPDDVIVDILSRMSIKDAVRTSVLSSRWRYLWMSMSVTLEFHDKDIATRKKFRAFVKHVLELYNRVDGLVIHFSNTRQKTESTAIDHWVYSAMLKQVKRFELDLSADCGFHCSYEFPSFLCIRASDATKHLRVVDPLPNLKELEISDCCNLESLEISATNLASCTYQGSEISLPFKKTRDPFELTLGGVFCKSFVYEPNKHSSYSAQLVKLVLNLQTEDVQREVRELHHRMTYLNHHERTDIFHFFFVTEHQENNCSS
ncbi:hypothetical protein MIMGU_mgv1a011261mg [Erythranthe guttata]|uniref:F-box domain-containing protein n=1 Tax=Erythranthe guttata TaxID=4155 RepID=A0A022RAM9_ERYGU|nr:hypothetical protein MIMGU_mgv1a011261mg [Erythranthe guttata]